jgi:nucleoid DNA-binding protein
MITKEIAREVSRKTGMTSQEAAHQVDRVVRDILKKLHSGQSATLPGLGKLIVGVGGRIRFRKERA